MLVLNSLFFVHVDLIVIHGFCTPLRCWKPLSLSHLSICFFLLFLVMGKNHTGFVKVDCNRTPRVPPGFESCTSFTLRRLQEDVTMAGGASSSTQNLMDIGENERFKKSLRWKPWLNYSQPNDSLEGESESEPVVQVSACF